PAGAVAEKCGGPRGAKDACGLGSQLRAARAIASGRLAKEIAPVEAGGKTVAVDEHPRPDATLEALGKLRPAFKKNGTVTAGNAAGLNDGAAAGLVASAAAGGAQRLLARARSAARGRAGVR